MRKFLVLALMAGCTQMTDYYPDAKTVEVRGQTFYVAPRPKLGRGVYLAGQNKPDLGEIIGTRDMSLPAANVAAIEAVTGCRVLRETVRNLSTGATFAAVDCAA